MLLKLRINTDSWESHLYFQAFKKVFFLVFFGLFWSFGFDSFCFDSFGFFLLFFRENSKHK